LAIDTASKILSRAKSPPHGGENVTWPVESRNEVLLESSIPEGEVSLESILCTEELHRRPYRPPDHENENRALVALVSALADSPHTILQTLAETILEITQSDSAGLSLLTKDDGGKRFYWPAIAGMWNPHVGGGTPRNFGPCGDVLDRNCTLLFTHFERRYPYLQPVIPAAEECLLVPFYVEGQAVGTIWAIMHGGRRKFDAEDNRVMGSLGKFASSAYQALESIDGLKFQVAEREKAETVLRELANGLETQVRFRTEELEQRNKQLTESRARIRRLVDANIMGVFTWDLEGKILEANEAFLNMLQYGREDLASGSVRWTDLTPSEWRDRDDRALTELKEVGTAQPYEKEFFRKNDSRVAVMVGGALFEEGGDEGVAFVLDLSEQKRAEERLRQAQTDLARINRVSTMGELTASLAHEIKQPISAAVTNAETCLQWLESDQPDIAEARQAASRLLTDAKRASDIISRIGMLFKKDVPRRELADINGVIQEMIALLRGEAARYSISIYGELADGLPRMMVDRVGLQQVLMNLMLNAIEAMKDMGTPGKITIRSQQDGNRQILVSVADTGVGLQSEDVEQIFNAFFTSKSQGTGMGLRISRSIVESHGGRLWAISAGGPGATFQFYLPVEAAAHAAP
jgi:PAS domain S-box-containing protein